MKYSKTIAPVAAMQTKMSPLLQLGLYFGALIALYMISSVVFAGDPTLSDVAKNVTGTMGDMAKLITASSYVAGVGFALMGMFKFKAHKDNATQTPLSQPIVLIAIAAGLIFLPSLIGTAGGTIFGDSGKKATAKGGGLDE